MNHVTALSLASVSGANVRRVPRQPMSLRVALLAQHGEFGEEPTPTDMMVYRQPASDVPVPSTWRPSRPAPLDPAQPPSDEADESEDESTLDDESDASLSAAFDSSHVVYQAMSAEARLYVWMCSGFATCTLAAWLVLA